jgi:hypothetical protein
MQTNAKKNLILIALTIKKLATIMLRLSLRGLLRAPAKDRPNHG